MLDQAKELTIVLTFGQSLSIGATAGRKVYSTNPRYPDNVLALDFGTGVPPATGWRSQQVDAALFRGFRPLREEASESPISGMMDTLVAAHLDAYGAAPTFLHINAASAGRSILELATASDEIFDSIETALLATTAGESFALRGSDGRYDFYLRTLASATFQYSDTGPLVFFDNLTAQLELAVRHARQNDYAVSPKLVLNWIQGQADSSGNYDLYLSDLLADIDRLAERVLGEDASVLTSVSQTRGYASKPVSLDQLQIITSRPDVIMGASEFQFQARFPSIVGADSTHMQPEGYFLMGQRIGRNLFDAMAGGENQPILIDQVEQIAPRSFLVRFSGVDNALVDDPSPFLSGSGMRAPPNLGFGSYTENGARALANPIISANIIGPDSVRIDFAADLLGNFRLYLGRTNDDLSTIAGYALPGFGGTTLRDAATIDSLVTLSGDTLRDPFLYEYAPIQFQLVVVNKTPVMPASLAARVNENSSVVFDIAATDDRDREGSGLGYALAGGDDAALFDIDGTSGVIRFREAPDFENPGDANRDNNYRLLVRASDSMGLNSISAVTVSVLGINEAPTAITLDSDAVDRFAPRNATVGKLSATDPDTGSVLTYALASNPDGLFDLDRATGRLFVADPARLADSPAVVAPISVRATDSRGLSYTSSLTIRILGERLTSIAYRGTDLDDIGNYAGNLAWTATGGAGSDQLTGGSGNDVISGDAGTDRLTGNAGADRLLGGDGDDILAGGPDNDELLGDAGNDRLDGGSGADRLSGGIGNDYYTVDNGGDQVIEADAQGADPGGRDRVYSAIDFELPDFVEDLFLIGNAMMGVGNALANAIIGNGTDNFLIGGGGTDRLVGNDGDDVLSGGAGWDALTGGTGSDLFLFGALDGTADTISDFEVGRDHIVMAPALFGADQSNVGDMDTLLFTTGTAAAAPEHRLIFNHATRTLSFDADGSGPLAAVKVVTFLTTVSLSVPDLLIG